MRNITYNSVDLKTIEKLINLSLKKGNDIEKYEGGLLNNYLIVNSGKITFGKAKARKYIIVKEKYLNEWSSTNDVIFTDDIELYNEWKNMLSCDEEEYDMEEITYKELESFIVETLKDDYKNTIDIITALNHFLNQALQLGIYLISFKMANNLGEVIGKEFLIDILKDQDVKENLYNVKVV